VVVSKSLGEVPFHLSTIKNIFLSIDKSTVSLRINFFTPSVAQKNIRFPDTEHHRNVMYLKELCLREEAGGHRLQELSKVVKDA
jgi:nucleosome binding factor SPN SPT16 subunit